MSYAAFELSNGWVIVFNGMAGGNDYTFRAQWALPKGIATASGLTAAGNSETVEGDTHILRSDGVLGSLGYYVGEKNWGNSLRSEQGSVRNDVNVHAIGGFYRGFDPDENAYALGIDAVSTTYPVEPSGRDGWGRISTMVRVHEHSTAVNKSREWYEVNKDKEGCAPDELADAKTIVDGSHGMFSQNQRDLDYLDGKCDLLVGQTISDVRFASSADQSLLFPKFDFAPFDEMDFVVVELSNGVLLWMEDSGQTPAFECAKFMYHQLRIDTEMYAKMTAEERVRFAQPFWVRGDDHKGERCEDTMLPFPYKVDSSTGQIDETRHYTSVCPR